MHKLSKFREITSNIADVLEYKNKNYGDSALTPVDVFIKVTSDVGIRVRLNDKINRIINCIKNGEELRKNDIFDLIGYLILLCISKSWISFTEFMD